ncbi:PP2C family protein-serine/threonine phosphatase [Streptomyces sp. SL13]|uniref:PP2C family protein-serine/threonine phosphatase n=1 Tax=Streptantibioticus silvisoli TaxID=2705255 RepID=A0AA90H8X8_9ACTN|nr:PP2C family protein-serine/threonine phosphatase [Streptantibioticus silvisoli]MDI5973270.1 PP2C family protein-serine/threonine phosphatase [Streptantibioticus silvisoli]
MPSAEAQRRYSGTPWRGPRAIVGLALVILVLVLIADVSGGSTVRLGGIMLALPALAAVFTGPVPVLVISGAMLPAYVGSLASNGRLTWADAPVSIATALVICAASVGASAVREKRVRELAQSRRVTVQTQQMLLRPLPPRLGPMEISSVYLASDAESTIGGDLYACAIVDGHPRVIVGDVQGKGLSTLEVVVFLLNAFRQAAQEHVALPDVPAYLDDAVRRDLARARDVVEESGDAAQAPEMEQRLRECFVTAVVVEFTGEGDEVRLANCGHPAPLLLHEGAARELPASKPALPIGLLSLATDPVQVDTCHLEPGDTLLLFTDGLIEARDGAGAYYPITDRISNWATQPPEAMLDAIQTDLRHHTQAHLDDDVAMVTVRRPTAREAG